MLKMRDGATLDPGERVEVYYNIQKGGFSIVALDKRNPMKGKVVAYASNVQVEDAKFCINPNKLAKIKANNRKTVYAVVRGHFVSAEPMDDAAHGYRKGYCNPFKTGKFIDWENGTELHEARGVYFYDKYFSYQEAINA
ncbi:hypothetical protein [Rossellomorea marisflavi]|uniref:hypothetical protein n=1 Tax=Rossellomorea marisflavi TaxID=189381 RepID=UPI0009A7A77B|nr:hypothetical protein [Rossellomorea marisflavi]